MEFTAELKTSGMLINLLNCLWYNSLRPVLLCVGWYDYPCRKKTSKHLILKG